MTHIFGQFAFDPETSRDLASLLLLAPRDLDAQQCASWCEANGVPLFAIIDDAIRGRLEPEKWLRAKELSIERAPAEKFVWASEYDAISSLLERQGMSPCLIKTYGPFPLWSGNIDAIIDESSFRKTLEILESDGYIRLHWLDEPYKVLLKKFKNGRPIVSLHLHSRIGWTATLIHNGNAMAGSRRSEIDKRIRMLGDGQLIATTLAHAFFENSEIRAIDLFILSKAMRSPESWQSARRIAADENWETSFSLATRAFLAADEMISAELRNDHLIQHEKIPHMERPTNLDAFLVNGIARNSILPVHLPWAITKTMLFRQCLVSDVTPGDLGRAARLWSIVTHFAIRKLGDNLVRGRIIAISGPDGSGKTTIAKELASAMGEIGITVRTYWSRYGTVPPAIYRLFARESAGEGSMKRGSSPKGAHPLKSDFRLAESICRLSTRSILSKLSGNSVILDRDFLDAEVDHLKDADQGMNLLIKIGRRIILNPDIHILLLTEPEILSKRSGETIERSGSAVDAYKKIISEGGRSSILSIDSGESVGFIIDELIRPLISRLGD